MKKHGFHYVATGLRKFIFEAIRSARSLRKYWPEVKISLSTDAFHQEALQGYQLFDQIIVNNNSCTDFSWSHHLTSKVRGILDSPHDITAFIDTDTLIKSSKVKTVFDVLGKSDIAMCPASEKTSRCANLASDSMYYTGFIVYDKTSPKTLKLLNDWVSEQESNIDKLDQGDFSGMNCIASATDKDKKFLLGTDQYSLSRFLRPDFNPAGLTVGHLGNEWNYHAMSDQDNIIIDTKPFQKLPTYAENDMGHYRPFYTTVAETFLGLTRQEREKLARLVEDTCARQGEQTDLFSLPNPLIREFFRQLQPHIGNLLRATYPGSRDTQGRLNFRARGKGIVFNPGEETALPREPDERLAGIYWLGVPEAISLDQSGGFVRLLDPISGEGYRAGETIRQGGVLLTPWNDALVVFPSYVRRSFISVQAGDRCLGLFFTVSQPT